MSGEQFELAWLEGPETESTPLDKACSIGRATGNDVVLGNEKVSRHHASIQKELRRGFWIADLGSINGTFINGRRITQSTRLKDGDRIEIGPFQLLFRHSSNNPATPVTESTGAFEFQKTVHELKPAECWLLLVDLIQATMLSQKLPPEELRKVIGDWFQSCRAILEESGGAIEKMLGDGFMAYWIDKPGVTHSFAGALQALKRMQESTDLKFRMVVHYGKAFRGGITASGAERFYGPEINFTFKMELTAKATGEPRLLSHVAWSRIQDRLPSQPLGEHEVTGFIGKHFFYSF